MIQHWLDPIGDSTHRKIRSSSLFANIEVYHTRFPDTNDTALAIVGTSPDADLIRERFYLDLKWQFGGLKIVDLGNLKKHEGMFLQPILQELVEGNIHPIILGFDFVDLGVIQRVLSSKFKRFNFANVSAYLPPLPDESPVACFPIAFQQHFLDSEQVQQFDTTYKKYLRLSAFRADPEAAEVLLRNSKYVNFDISSVRAAEAPGQLKPSPNGLFSEEWCQLMRFAGIGDGNSVTSISGFSPENDQNQQTANLIAHGIWYFIDGYHSRIGDYPFSVSKLVEYVVDVPALEQYHVAFWKSSKSGRWWLDVHLVGSPQGNKKNLTPCTYNDYLQACNNEIPERLFQLIENIQTGN